MAIDIEKAIKNMYDLKDRGITYSMNGSRTGSDGTGDCSGTIYDSLRKAGATDAGWILNTDSMHDWLLKNGFKCIASNQEWSAKRGDIVIFGLKGQSGGAAGHVVIFTSQYRIIHCTWKDEVRNGVYEDDSENTCPYSMGWYVYRLDQKTNQLTWKQDSKGWWLVDSNGKLPKGWQKVSGKWYYINPSSGYMVTGWLETSKNKWYFLETSGAMVEDTRKIIGGIEYIFDKSGLCLNYRD